VSNQFIKAYLQVLQSQLDKAHGKLHPTKRHGDSAVEIALLALSEA
jgi:hypothetical protein